MSLDIELSIFRPDVWPVHRIGINLENSVESHKSAQALDAPDKSAKMLITNKVTTAMHINSIARLLRAQLSFLG